jgi:hypothetical protein
MVTIEKSWRLSPYFFISKNIGNMDRVVIIKDKTMRRASKRDLISLEKIDAKILMILSLKNNIIANKVPKFKNTSKARLCFSQFSIAGKIIRCAELEIGRYSVKPCTSPKIIA